MLLRTRDSDSEPILEYTAHHLHWSLLRDCEMMSGVDEGSVRTEMSGCLVLARVLLDILHLGWTMLSAPILLGLFLVLLGARLDGVWTLSWTEVFFPVLVLLLGWVLGFVFAMVGHCSRAPEPAPLEDIEAFNQDDPPFPVPAGMEGVIEAEHERIVGETAGNGSILQAAGHRWRRKPATMTNTMLEDVLGRYLGTRDEDLEALRDAPLHPICRCGAPASCCALLATGDDTTLCGSYVRHCIFDRVRRGPTWLAVTLQLLIVVCVFLQPILVWQRLSPSSSVSSWSVALVPTWLFVAALALGVLPQSVMQCQWSYPRLITGLLGGLSLLCCGIIPLALLVAHADSRSVPAGVVILPWLIAHVCCCVPLAAVLLHVQRRAPPPDPPRDPHVVLQELNPFRQEAAAASSSVDQRREDGGVQVGPPRRAPAVNPSASSPAAPGSSSRNNNVSTREVMLGVPSGSGTRPVVAPSHPPPGTTTTQTRWSRLRSQSGSQSAGDSGSGGGNGGTQMAREPLYNHRRILGVGWGVWLALWVLLTNLLLVAWELAWGIGDGIGFRKPDQAEGGVRYLAVLSPGIAICVVWTVWMGGLTLTLLRRREALGGIWSGFYSGRARAIFMNNANSLE